MSSNARLDRRREELRKLAIKAGWKSWYIFETAVANHRVEIPPPTVTRIVKSPKGVRHAR
jgi:peptidyl-tRNA hydrolase